MLSKKHLCLCYLALLMLGLGYVAGKEVASNDGGEGGETSDDGASGDDGATGGDDGGAAVAAEKADAKVTKAKAVAGGGATAAAVAVITKKASAKAATAAPKKATAANSTKAAKGTFECYQHGLDLNPKMPYAKVSGCIACLETYMAKGNAKLAGVSGYVRMCLKNAVEVGKSCATGAKCSTIVAYLAEKKKLALVKTGGKAAVTAVDEEISARKTAGTTGNVCCCKTALCNKVVKKATAAAVETSTKKGANELQILAIISYGTPLCMLLVSLLR